MTAEMNISKIHKRYSERLNNPRVLTNPEEFLGQNFEAVLNYWLILDGLSEDQWETIEGRYWNFCDNQWSEWRKARDEAYRASEETIGWELAFKAVSAVLDVYRYGAAGLAAGLATRELIRMHKILEQQKPLTFLPMFLEVL